MRKAPDEFRFKPEMLESKDERQKLPKRADPYWAKIGTAGTTAVLLGYHARKGEAEWRARWVDEFGNSNHTGLGIAADRDGTKGALTHAQARKRAEEWARAQMQRRR